MRGWQGVAFEMALVALQHADGSLLQPEMQSHKRSWSLRKLGSATRSDSVTRR
jgi:hypothetical protein